jgi:hypothetical protein
MVERINIIENYKFMLELSIKYKYKGYKAKILLVRFDQNLCKLDSIIGTLLLFI